MEIIFSVQLSFLTRIYFYSCLIKFFIRNSKHAFLWVKILCGQNNHLIYSPIVSVVRPLMVFHVWKLCSRYGSSLEMFAEWDDCIKMYDTLTQNTFSCLYITYEFGNKYITSFLFKAELSRNSVNIFVIKNNLRLSRKNLINHYVSFVLYS